MGILTPEMQLRAKNAARSRKLDQQTKAIDDSFALNPFVPTKKTKEIQTLSDKESTNRAKNIALGMGVGSVQPPYSNTGVRFSTESRIKPENLPAFAPKDPSNNNHDPYPNCRWDWYQTTLDVPDGSDPIDLGLVEHLQQAWPMSDWMTAKNLNGYQIGGQLVIGQSLKCHACWGGQKGINLKTTSEESPKLAQSLKNYKFKHKPTRVDACLDWREEGLFDRISALLLEFAGTKLAINQVGDWQNGIARTLYLGSKNSPVRLVLYEKGYETGYGAPKDWVRLEVRVRPTKESRAAVALWEPKDAFGAGWVAKACKFIGLPEMQKTSVGTVWTPSDDLRARLALTKQYARTLAKWAEDCGGWENLGTTIKDSIAEHELLRNPDRPSPNPDLLKPNPLETLEHP